MAALRRAPILFCLALIGFGLASRFLCAQTPNPLRDTKARQAAGPVRVQLADVPWVEEESALEDEARFRLVSDEEDLPPIAPPMRAPTKDFIQPHDQPPLWPDGRPSNSRPPQFAPGYLPPTDPDLDGWNSDEEMRYPRRSHRYTGWGQPLYGTSWLNRPYYVGAYIGQAFLDDPLFDVQQSNAALPGLRLGWDFDYYWGLETRFAYAQSNLTATGTSTVGGLGRNYFVDVALLWYPSGDSRWRPFLTAGLGAATTRIQYNGAGLHDTALEFPLGVGLKYFCSPWSTVRWEFQYAPTFGTQRLDPMHNMAIGLGGEIRFGGNPRSYFPWTGNTAYW